MKIIVHPSDEGITIRMPAGELPFEEVCRKDVPYGVPYKILEYTPELQKFITDNALYREAFQVDFSNPDGFGLGEARWFVEANTKDAEFLADLIAHLSASVEADKIAFETREIKEDENVAESEAVFLDDIRSRENEISNLCARRECMLTDILKYKSEIASEEAAKNS